MPTAGSMSQRVKARAPRVPFDPKSKTPRRMSQSVTDVITCPICLEVFVGPKMLPCQHTFCLLCLQNYNTGASARRGTFKCPQCRRDVEVPESGMNGFPNNISVQSFIDALTQERVNLNSPANDVAAAGPHQQLLRELEKGHRGVQDQINRFQTKCTSIVSEISLAAEKRIQEIFDEKNALIQQVEASKTQAVCAMEAAAKRIQENIQRLNQEKEGVNAEEVKALLTESATSATFELDLDAKSFTFSLGKSSSSAGKEDSPPSPLPLMGAEIREFPSPASSSTSLASSSASLASSSTSRRKSRSDSTWTLKNHNHLLGAWKSRSLSLKHQITTTGLHRPVGIAVSPWSQEVFAVSTETLRVMVFDLVKGKLVRSFGSKDNFMYPSGIALDGERQEIFVSDKYKHCIHVLSKEGKYLRQLGFKGNTGGHFNSPEGIAVDSQGRVYVCDTGNARVQILDRTGIYMGDLGGTMKIDLLTGKKVVETRFMEPTDVAVGADGTAAVADTGFHRVEVFNVRGGPNEARTKHKVTVDQFFRAHTGAPHCVVVDAHGTILVGDNGNQCIQMLKWDGSFLRTFSDSKIAWVAGIAVTPTYDIVFTDFKKHFIGVIS